MFNGRRHTEEIRSLGSGNLGEVRSQGAVDSALELEEAESTLLRGGREEEQAPLRN